MRAVSQNIVFNAAVAIAEGRVACRGPAEPFWLGRCNFSAGTNQPPKCLFGNFFVLAATAVNTNDPERRMGRSFCRLSD